ncbi:MAG: hypothetical protein L3J23_00010 [Flavobacteriaceae bacterium]|nr:hypothetical protein [Flavobacteriaceae bacterium]
MKTKKTLGKFALIRIKVIDECLQKHKHTIEDLMKACAKELKKYDPTKIKCSRRTVEGDLRKLKDNRLGFKAPIIVTNKKYHSYSDPKFTITNYPIPLSDTDYQKLEKAVAFIKIYQNFPNISELKERLD